MPVIREEEERQAFPDLDSSQFLGLADHVALTEADQAFAGFLATSAPADVAEPSCPAHPGQDNGFMGNWDLLETPVVQQHINVDERKSPALLPPDYSKLENWIPRFIRPKQPLSHSQLPDGSNYVEGSPALLDTLHLVDENDVIDHGHFNRIKDLHSNQQSSGKRSTVRFNDDASGSTKRNGIRFPRHAVKTLRDWLDGHRDHPYPSKEERAALEKQTELKPSQIANWLANARRRKKVTEKARPKLCMSPSLRPTTPAIDILNGPEKSWDELNPFERWKHSPPEHEPASITDIAQAVASSDLPENTISRSPSSGRRKRSSNGSGFSSLRASSTTSLETSAQSSSLSASSAAFSQGSSNSHGSFGSFSSSLAGKKDRRRRRRNAPAIRRRTFDGNNRIFQCTFCTDTFKSKYDWTRHEKSLHLSLEKWICAPLGPTVVSPASGVKKCVYCEIDDPLDDHAEAHNHHQCEAKGLDSRTFFRKDHLRQHLRLMHGCEMKPHMDQWKSVAININSRCGFCAQRFIAWQERVDHLTAHFKAGARMTEWKGCRGLDPAVAAQVTNAMPPYLIGIESVSPNPFSASNQATWRQRMPSDQGDDDFSNLKESDPTGPALEPLHSDHGVKATCWEILTVRLGKYADEMAQRGAMLSDEMLQKQARRILYESDDSWDQTAADNPEWLDLFKKAHGLDFFIPSELGGQGLLETYGDLGLRIPFHVQLAAYNQAQANTQISDAANVPEPYSKALERKRQEFRSICSLLSKEGVLLHEEKIVCDHDECAQNVIDVSKVDGKSEPGPRYNRWCTYTVAPEKAKKLALTAVAVDGPADLGAFMGDSGAGHRETDDAGNGLECRTTSTNAEGAALVRAGGVGMLTDCENKKCTFHDINRNEEARAAASLRARGLVALERVHAPISSCNCDCHAEPVRQSRKAPRPERHQDRLDAFASATARCEGSASLEAAKSRAQCLDYLGRLHGPMTCDCDDAQASPNPHSRVHQPRHKLQLPIARARLFETTTGAWEDAGKMPATTYTASRGEVADMSMRVIAEEDLANTGAMMDVRGSQFSGGQETAMSGMMGDFDLGLGLPNAPATDDQALKELDDLIAATFAFPNQAVDEGTASAEDLAMVLNNEGAAAKNDVAMDDFDFDDVTFDGAFDMPFDERDGVDDDFL
ncbi:Homeobox protein TGIF1 [Teratosphaeria destructans]|uniref:Homeobox protein TGIF1 n=1 Tax=Teratosphaeria destructans TaxID=418781 RepID=A0A9W7W799_9PEZI|nr:Homeobox protein TGIF1 [Teratosphaeria destructans]